MNNPQRRPGKAKRAVILVAKGFAYLIIATAIWGWITIIIVGNFVWDANDPKPATPTPTPATEDTPITWQLTSQQCQDGWPSNSIGTRGACSSHGGVTNTYTTTDGQLTTRCGPRYQARTLERAHELTLPDGTIDCDFEHPPTR